MWTRDTAAESRPRAFYQNGVIYRLSAESPAERGGCAGCSMGHISTRSARGIARNPGPMRYLVADERSTTTPPFGIEEVHEPESNP
jgi:hypothetical protein